MNLVGPIRGGLNMSAAKWNIILETKNKIDTSIMQLCGLVNREGTMVDMEARGI